MEELKKSFLEYMNQKKLMCEQEERNLRSDGRDDEANFEKVKSNIYDIFTTLFQGAVKTATDIDQLTSTFLPRFEKIPMNWKIRLETAKQHNDAETICIEEMKLGIAQEIKEKYIELSKR